jgi:GNAT superfamily N-acetyltransferase
MHYEWQRGEYTISTDPDLLDVIAIHRFLSEETYWAKGRAIEITLKSIEHSICFGLYYGAHQVGFARVISDYATFGYIMDVFVLPQHRRLGLGKWLVQSILSHPELQEVTRWVLRTRDAHSLYARFGFGALAKPETTMELRKPSDPNNLVFETHRNAHAQSAVPFIEPTGHRWR